MNVRLICSECGDVIEATCPGDEPVDGPVECECGARFIVTVTRLI